MLADQGRVARGKGPCGVTRAGRVGLAENLKGTKSLWPQTIITCSYRLFTFFHFAVTARKATKDGN